MNIIENTEKERSEKEKQTFIITNNIIQKKDKIKICNKNKIKDIFLKIFICAFLFFLLFILYHIYFNYYNSSKNSIRNIVKEEVSNIVKDKLKNIVKKELNKEFNKTYKDKEEFSNMTDKNFENENNEDILKKNESLNIINSKKKRVGIVSVENDQNPGNNLIKYAMSTKLKEYGFDPIIIARLKRNSRIDFLSKTVKLKIIKNNFNELKKEDYDILMINSDLCWTFSNRAHFYDNAFLKFAYNWETPKFIYAASMGTMNWFYRKKDDEMAKIFLKDFKGISFREMGTAKMAKEHLGINYTFVLDPTFLIDKSYYLDLIKDYKKDLDFDKKYIMIYQLDKNPKIKEFIHETEKKLNFTLYEVSKDDDFYVKNFLFAMNNSQAVITDSYHGTVFSIIFNKPFLSFINYGRGGIRFVSLKETFNLNNRIINSSNSRANLSLLLEPLNINETRLNELKNISINFLKKNLGLSD